MQNFILAGQIWQKYFILYQYMPKIIHDSYENAHPLTYLMRSPLEGIISELANEHKLLEKVTIPEKITSQKTLEHKPAFLVFFLRFANTLRKCQTFLGNFWKNYSLRAAYADRN